MRWSGIAIMIGSSFFGSIGQGWDYTSIYFYLLKIKAFELEDVID